MRKLIMRIEWIFRIEWMIKRESKDWMREWIRGYENRMNKRIMIKRNTDWSWENEYRRI